MEADILKSKKDIYLVQKYGADILESKKGSISCPEVWRPIFWKVKRIYILSRSMEANMFNKRISVYGYIL